MSYNGEYFIWFFDYIINLASLLIQMEVLWESEALYT